MTEELTFGERLLEVQSELKAPKSQYNKFGGYNYRNCEDILEAAKPLLREHRLLLTITDEPVCIEGRFYVKATATISDDKTGGRQVQATAYAREELEKKGMDAAQVTGSASSYARKYALNGLFLIDDSKDADYPAQEKQPPQSGPVNGQCAACGAVWSFMSAEHMSGTACPTCGGTSFKAL